MTILWSNDSEDSDDEKEPETEEEIKEHEKNQSHVVDDRGFPVTNARFAKFRHLHEEQMKRNNWKTDVSNLLPCENGD